MHVKVYVVVDSDTRKGWSTKTTKEEAKSLRNLPDTHRQDEVHVCFGLLYRINYYTLIIETTLWIII